MSDIFLSYTREDQPTAQRFAEGFEAEGFTVWWDATLRSGEVYDQVTEEALRAAKAVVVLWSKRSVVSRWVRAEATLADRNRTLVPAMIEPCERPIMFELTQTPDLSHWTGETTSPAWRAFLADVRRFVQAGAAPHPPSPPAAAPPSLTRPSVGVLPFINRSGREDDEAFAIGMVEDVTAALSGSRWLDILAADATAIYRTGPRDLRQIGRDLGVRYLLEGNVRRAGLDMRVTAQLLEADSGKILWARKFDRPLAELPFLQEDLVAEVAAHLGVEVERAEMEHALRKPGDISAWERAMRGTAYSSRATRSGWEAAVTEGKRRLDIDPDDGEAHASIASAQSQLLHYRGEADPELAREAAENVRRARALDPDNPVVLQANASSLAALGKLRDALELAERTVSLTPNYAQAHILLASVLIRLGRSDDALPELDATERLAPNSWLAYHSWLWRAAAHLQVGRLGQALEATYHAVRFRAGTEALALHVLCLAKSGQEERAHEALRRLCDMDPETSRGLVENMICYFCAGADDLAEYVAIARRIWDEEPDLA